MHELVHPRPFRSRTVAGPKPGRTGSGSALDTRLFRYIWRYSWREQAVILAVVLLSFVPYFMSLDLPKTIVNQAIQGEGFPTPQSTVPFLRLSVPLPALAGGGEATIFHGVPLERIPYLFVLSFAFLGLVIVNNGFKRQINTLKGRMGERMLRRVRYQLFDSIMRFPLPHLKKVKSAELATMIKDEVEPLGGFIADAFVSPAFLGGQVLVALLFIMLQSVYLGGVALLVLAAQVIFVPLLRRRILVLGRQRQLTARELAGRIAETVDGALEVHANDASNRDRADIADRLGRIFQVRFAIYQRKFSIKALNNFLSQLPPFVFYAVGGYLAIIGRLDIGALVAVIAAYKDLPGPLKELIDWDQMRLDVQIKYEQVITQFEVDGLLDSSIQAPGSTLGTTPVDTRLTAHNLSYTDEIGVKFVDGVSFAVEPGERIAMVGPEGSGKSELALLLARLLRPSSGRIDFGGVDLSDAPEAFTGRRLAYVGPNTYLRAQSIRDNLLFAVRHQPQGDPAGDPQASAEARRRAAEARRIGNTDLDFASDWVDYAAAGVAGPAEMTAKLIELLRAVSMESDLYEFGMRAVVDPSEHPALIEHALRIRHTVRARLADPPFAALVEPFDHDSYIENISVGENLLFGLPVGRAFDMDDLAGNPYVAALVERVGLTRQVLAAGRSVAATMVELFKGLSPDDPFFEQYSFIRSQDLPAYEAALRVADADGLDALPEELRRRLMSLTFKVVTARHRLDVVDAALKQRIVFARDAFAQHLPPALQGAIAFFDAAKYNHALTLLDNVLFGRIVHGQAEAAKQVSAIIAAVLDELGLRQQVLAAGLDHQVGVAGARLSAAQRQKLAIARAMLKRPDVLILNEATAVLDAEAERHIRSTLLDRAKPWSVVWVMRNTKLVQPFDRILVIKDGRVCESGPFDELSAEGSAFRRLMDNE